MSKFLFLDKDGTLIETVSGDKFVNQPTDQRAIGSACAELEQYVLQGWIPIIISNQGGVESGYKSLNDAIAEMQFAMGLLTRLEIISGVRLPMIYESYFCPCDPKTAGDHCWRVPNNPALKPTALNQVNLNTPITVGFRKPNPGMIQTAIATWREQGDDVREQDCLFVGDRPEDQESAAAAGIPFQWAHEWRSDDIRF